MKKSTKLINGTMAIRELRALMKYLKTCPTRTKKRNATIKRIWHILDRINPE